MSVLVRQCARSDSNTAYVGCMKTLVGVLMYIYIYIYIYIHIYTRTHIHIYIHIYVCIYIYIYRYIYICVLMHLCAVHHMQQLIIYSIISC